MHTEKEVLVSAPENFRISPGVIKTATMHRATIKRRANRAEIFMLLQSVIYLNIMISKYLLNARQHPDHRLAGTPDGQASNSGSSIASAAANASTWPIGSRPAHQAAMSLSWPVIT